ncbi:MAG TPA: F0F1 ATP synthase subunit delta [Verrucomicrobiae bacterium]|nr:F0F1 ATP synthase subunit delta [Verrucomicrobiae bacterium]
MLSGAVSRRYAQALYEIAVETNQLDVFEADLKALAEGIESNPEIQKVLYHPQISLADKKGLLRQVFGGQFSAHVQNFVDMVIDRRRQNFLGDIYNEFKLLANAKRNVLEARIKSAVDLDKSQQDQLQANLSKLTGKSIRLVAEVDPSLIGGVVVKIGDRVIDGSVAGRLAKLRETLVQQ